MENFKIKKHSFIQFFYILLILFIIMLLIIFPSLAIVNFSQGILIWATSVLPALLPFFILTKLLSYTQFTHTIGKFLSPITNKLYNVGGVAGYIYIMSIMSGYPIGAKLTADFYKSGKITKSQAHSISAFTSTSGPLFIIGTVGIGLFNNKTLGIIVLISHFIGAFINGILYRNKKDSYTLSISQPITTNNPLNESMTGSITSIMVVGGFIAIFYMILQLLISINAFALPIALLKLLGINENISTSLIAGIIEVTTGAKLLSQCQLNIILVAPILSFLISFGGLSIHAQAFCFLKDFNMSYGKFFIQKITHAIISTLVTLLIIFIIN